jgi:2TM family of unknown function (DUF5676)
LNEEGSTMKHLTIRGTAVALGLFFDVTFLLCILSALVMPSRLGVMAKIWEAILPGFTWLTPGGMLLGLIELFLYGIYVALVFVPLFNYFEGGRSTEIEKPIVHGLPRETATHR